jgi:hypothetical protein
MKRRIIVVDGVSDPLALLLGAAARDALAQARSSPPARAALSAAGVFGESCSTARTCFTMTR